MAAFSHRSVGLLPKNVCQFPDDFKLVFPSFCQEILCAGLGLRPGRVKRLPCLPFCISLSRLESGFSLHPSGLCSGWHDSRMTSGGVFTINRMCIASIDCPIILPSPARVSQTRGSEAGMKRIERIFTRAPRSKTPAAVDPTPVSAGGCSASPGNRERFESSAVGGVIRRQWILFNISLQRQPLSPESLPPPRLHFSKRAQPRGFQFIIGRFGSRSKHPPPGKTHHHTASPLPEAGVASEAESRRGHRRLTFLGDS